MSKHNWQLTFHGGVGTVTGANFLLETHEGLRMLVDCGMQQGVIDEKNDPNKADFAYDPASIDLVIITHAHIDHIGRLPKLVHDGFRGVIYGTKPTKDLAEIMLADSARIAAYEAKKSGGEPWFDQDDVGHVMALWQTYDYYKPFDIGPDIHVSFHDAGHILGSAIVKIQHNGKNIVFTGDLGNSPSPLLRDTDVIDDADYMIMESVYGDRNHETRDERQDRLTDIFREGINRGGAIMVPIFSVERTQEFLYECNNLIEGDVLPSVPVFLDSPLAIRATEIYRHYTKYFNDETQNQISSGDDIFSFPRLRFTETKDESKEINHVPNPKIIFAGAGMSHAGRIIHHEMRYLSDPNSTLVIVGYQGAGTLGRRLLDKPKQITMRGHDIKIRARIEQITGYSGHKDSENLIEFVSKTADRVQKVFCVMGEPKAATFLAQRLRDYLGVQAVTPQAGSTAKLEL